MKTTSKFWVVILLIIVSAKKTNSCTIFYIEKEGIVFAGNNEDWEDNASMMFFYPATGEKNGWIKFGWGSGFPQGGMNEKGLFWDGTSGPFLAMPESEARKIKLQIPIMEKIIEECGTVAEAKNLFAKFYCQDQYKAQYLVGDSAGNSMIVEGDYIIAKNKEYQVLTNFYQTQPELGGYPCWRYKKACELLQKLITPNVYEIGQVLSSTHQEGRYPTQYSNIYDLKNQRIYLFHLYNYEEYILINLKDELKKGYRTFKIPELFSNIKIISPLKNEAIKGTEVTFSWNAIPENSYEIIYSETPDFSDCKTIIAALSENNKPDFHLTFLPVYFLVFFVSFKRKKTFAIIILLLFVSFQCKKDEPEPEKKLLFSKTIIEFTPGKKYYWKIKAIPKNTDEFYSETITYHFTIN